MTPTQMAMAKIKEEWEHPLRERIAELEAALANLLDGAALHMSHEGRTERVADRRESLHNVSLVAYHAAHAALTK